ncbi:MAG TPA: hypothetical protein VKA31_04500 [Mariprofundaceae bacterium]|nr:hypothetical protein [Mariprofundaceae bacterium]
MNHVEASVEFYFKGIRHTPEAIINLDECMRHEEPLVHIYKALAAENGIGSYSHEFDVMVMEEISFDHPTGLATAFVRNGKFDFEGFEKAWLAERTLKVLQPIASKYLGVENLEKHPDIKAALIAAYQAE